MSQSRARSLAEATTNVAVGYLFAILLQMGVLPLFGFRATVTQHMSIALVFTAASLLRSYAVRRLFVRFGGAVSKSQEGGGRSEVQGVNEPDRRQSGTTTTAKLAGGYPGSEALREAHIPLEIDHSWVLPGSPEVEQLGGMSRHSNRTLKRSAP